jgi:exoribonuclease R
VPLSVIRLGSPSSDELLAAFARLRSELELSESFPAEVEDEAGSAVENVTLPDADLLDIPFVTIDPEGATDLDQALHLERSGDGYRVFYAIADVPAFVAPGGAIDAEARRRGQTMYAPDGRIPLHPTIISESAASLLPDQLRGAFVWTFELNAHTDVTSVTLTRARVRSRRQCSYAEVQAEIDGGTATESLQLLKEVGLGRIVVERERGGASLNRPDEEVVSDDGSYSLVRRAGLPAEDWNAQLSLMTGMAAASIMLDGGVGILRTMPAPSDETIHRFRLQVEALGQPWPEDLPYGEYLRGLDQDDPRQLAIIHAAGSLFRGAGYTAFDGELPEGTVQAAVGAPYAHTTAPLRRLVDRFSLLVCEALTTGAPIPDWLREALPTLPKIMSVSDGIASRLDNGAIDAVEAALLSTRVGEEFEAKVISAKKDHGVVQLVEPAVTANVEGVVEPGATVRVVLVTADIASGTIAFRLAE